MRRTPRAWHTLIAAAWSVSGAQPDTASGMVSLVDIMSTAVWVLFALLAVVTGQRAATLARRVGLSSFGAGVSGLLAGSFALLPSFLGNYQGLGFENSVFAAVLLAVVARELLERPDHPVALVVCGASTALMANAWQLLLPATGAAFIFCGVALLRRARRTGIAWSLVVGLAELAIAAPGLVAVVRGVGIGHASDARVVAPLPVLLLPLGCLALVIVVVRRSHDVRVLGFAAMLSLPALAGLAVAA